MLSKPERERYQLLLEFDSLARQQGYRLIAGVDEAGRGPLAGPVVAAACILPEGLLIEGIDDSKKLSSAVRAEIFKEIKSRPDIAIGIGIIDQQIIDQINILRATFEAMCIAIAALKVRPDLVLVDGNRLPHIDIPARAIVKGDSRSLSIAAASIVAKETRDELMRAYHAQWPQYNFLENKGYGTRKHLEAIDRHGPCPIHRLSFAPFLTTGKSGGMITKLKPESI